MSQLVDRARASIVGTGEELDPKVFDRLAAGLEPPAGGDVEIDHWRWEGVPFFFRTGKRLPVMQTEVWLVFKHAPQPGFTVLERRPDPHRCSMVSPDASDDCGI